jgi:hypothetical protein
VVAAPTLEVDVGGGERGHLARGVQRGALAVGPRRQDRAGCGEPRTHGEPGGDDAVAAQQVAEQPAGGVVDAILERTDGAFAAVR